MPTITHTDLTRITREILEAAGAPADSARVVSTSLIEANLQGHDSHGVLRLPGYIDFVRRGRIRPDARPSVRWQRGAAACVDGQLGWGMPTARLAAETAIELAAAQGVGAVTIVRCNHLGRLGEYVTMIAEAGMIGLAHCNASRSVAPFGSSQRILGTNPFAWAAPRGAGHPPLVLDFATSAVAEGKLRVARASGQPIAPGLIVDQDGQPSQDPADFYNGGALQTFGLHKGSGMSLMIELLARGLAGVDPTLPDSQGFNGTVLIALNITAFAPAEQFQSAAERLCAEVAEARRLDGVDEVFMPGQPEQRTRAQRLASGIPLADATWGEVAALATELGVAISS
jgi:LDH2 family malate/lactate/ureidoglycolate dehydrogenase